MAGCGQLCRDLVTLRFKGEYNGVVFDDLFKVEEPYFFRVGSGNILKVRTVALLFPHVARSVLWYAPASPTRLSPLQGAALWRDGLCTGCVHLRPVVPPVPATC